MSEGATERLYDLLPAVYRVRDKAQGEPLRALLAVMEAELQAIEEDIEGLYENWFIETCDEWVVPYIGDLLGVRGLHAGRPGIFSLRALVANTLAYRRGKGTAVVLENLARDTTGWDARVVEFFELLETTQHVNHIRPLSFRTPDLRDAEALEHLDTAFDTIAHTPDVRRVAANRGRYNVPNVGLFLWRLQSYFVESGAARAVTDSADGRYTFDPLGRDVPLFNRPQTRTEDDRFAEEIHVPGRLRRRPLREELEAHRQALVDEKVPRSVYFDCRHPVLQVFVKREPDAEHEEIPPEEILVDDLSDWRLPPSSLAYTKTPNDEVSALPIGVAVDPILGRLAFPADSQPEQVQVSYAYGFSGDVGGGPYNRTDSVSSMLSEDVDWQVGVSRESTSDDATMFASLAEAIERWNERPEGTVGVIAISDNGTYPIGDEVKIEVPEGSRLAIVAAGWPELAPDDLRPHLSGNLMVEGTANSSSNDPGKLILDGLLIEGSLTVDSGNLGSLRVAHCTLAPGLGRRLYASQNKRLSVRIERSICGFVRLTPTIPYLHITESIVAQGVEARGAAVHVETSTVMGENRVCSLEASNTIFAGRVRADRRQVGCVRYCYFPDGSQVPRGFRCQPQLEITTRVQAAEKEAQARGKELSQAERDGIKSGVQARLRPIFTSTQYGHPGYAQLAQACAEEIRTGAEDGSEMGVFGYLAQPQREANLRASLDEYLRFGLEAGIVYVT